MEDKYSPIKQHSGIWKSLRDGDFEEEEIWDVLKHKPDYSSTVHKLKDKGSSPIPVPRSIPTAGRMVPRFSKNNHHSASSSHEAKVLQQSAPVNIPDWSKIHNKASKNVSRFDDNGSYHAVVNDDDDGDGGVNYYGGDSDDNDEYDSKLPPHEFIAKRLARSHISSFSVLEGAGRTLKGRDLSRVRNAVLSKTGFLE